MAQEQDSTATLSDEQQRERLLAMAEEYDREHDAAEATSSAEQDENAKPEGYEPRTVETSAKQTKENPDNPESSAEGKEKTDDGKQPRNEKGQFASKQNTEGQQEQSQEQSQDGGKPESNYSKAKKDQERFDRNWKKLNEQQEAVRQREAELARREQELMQRNQAPQQTGNQAPRIPSQHYKAAVQFLTQKAKALIQEGDYEGAQEQYDLADRARAEAERAAHEEAQEAHAKGFNEFNQKWEADVAAVIKTAADEGNPELADPNSEIGQEVLQLFKAEPYLRSVPGGFSKAYEVIKLRRAAAEVSGLRTKVQEQAKEIERLHSLTTPQTSRGLSSHGKPTKFEDMSPEEQRAHLLRQAERQDAAA